MNTAAVYSPGLSEESFIAEALKDCDMMTITKEDVQKLREAWCEEYPENAGHLKQMTEQKEQPDA